MRIYTSYFAKSRALKKHNIEMIGIAQWPPTWFYGHSIKSVSPPEFLLRKIKYGDCSHEDYERIYQEQVLDKLDIDLLYKQIESLSNGKDVALCCYEKPEDFCHRHLLAAFLRKHGYDVQEFNEENINGKQELLFS